MSLGNTLLQPQSLQFDAGDEPLLEVAQDLLRLAALLAEDAIDDGPLVSIFPDMLSQFEETIRTQVESGTGSVFSALKQRFHPLFLYFDNLLQDINAVEEDPATMLVIIRQIIAGVRSVLEGLNQAKIKAQLDFGKDLLEQHLGIGPQFLNGLVGIIPDIMISLWQALPSDISPKQRRRKHLAIRLARRIRSHLTERFTLPEINTALIASKLYKLLESGGLAEIFDDIHCALDKMDEALDAVGDINAALPFSVGGNSVGAAIIEPEGVSRYCWYASWLLSDVDIPLLGLCDFDDAKLFAINIRFRNSVIKKQAAVSKYLFSTLTLEQQQTVMEYPGGSTEPEDSLMIMLAAQINMLMQQGPLYTDARFNTAHPDQSEQDLNALPFEFRLREDERFTLPEDLQEMANEYRDDQELFLFNRRFLEWVYGTGEDDEEEILNKFGGGSRRDVYITGDKRYLMCDDIPLYTVPEGTELKWQDAPLFIDKDVSELPVDGATYYRFERIDADACEIFAQILYTMEQSARPIWHLVDLQPGHEVGTGIISGLDILHALNMIFFGKPISGYQSLQECGLFGRCGFTGTWGNWLAHDYAGPRGLALFLSTLQGMHTDSTFWARVAFFFTIVVGDVSRVVGHNSVFQTIRDFLLTFVTLLNSSESNSGDSSLPDNPAANHLKQGGIIDPTNLLFAYLLMLNYKRENHSIHIWTAGDIGDRREHAFGLWIGGGIGFGILSGLAGSIVSQFIAWQEDFKLLGFTILDSICHMLLRFWLYEYIFMEGDTADGTMALTGAYKGYPAKANSPYRLPAADGETLYMNQGNNGMFSHNEISNIGSNWQVYAYDLGFDHRQVVRAMRAGVVWCFTDTNTDNSDDPNFIIIKHTTLVPDHDDPRGTGTPVVTFARYLHGANLGVTNVLEVPGGGTIQEECKGDEGTSVSQGAPIMQADHTGNSFHSHVHIDVVMGVPTVVQTNWFSNQTATNNVRQVDASERVQLDGATTGSIEGTVTLNPEREWIIEFSVNPATGPGSDAGDSVTVLIDGAPVATVPNDPAAGTVQVRHSVFTNSITYRIEFTSSHTNADLHQIVNAGTATTFAPGNESIPFVFEDVNNDEGLMKALTWHRAGG